MRSIAQVLIAAMFLASLGIDGCASLPPADPQINSSSTTPLAVPGGFPGL